MTPVQWATPFSGHRVPSPNPFDDRCPCLHHRPENKTRAETGCWGRKIPKRAPLTITAFAGPIHSRKGGQIRSQKKDPRKEGPGHPQRAEKPNMAGYV